jgi:hypothetical protein
LGGDFVGKDTGKKMQKVGFGHPTIPKKASLPPRISSPMNGSPKPQEEKDARRVFKLHGITKHLESPNQMKHSVSKFFLLDVLRL